MTDERIDRAAALIDAFDALPILPEMREAILPSAVHLLLLMTDPSDVPDTAFVEVGRKKSLDEINHLAKALAMLADAIEGLHKPAIKALADQFGLTRGHLGDTRHLRSLVQLISSVRLDHIPYHALRSDTRSTRHAHVIAKLLRKYYLDLTGFEPTIRTTSTDHKAYGPFIDLVSAVFQAGNIAGSPESAARSAMEKKICGTTT